jgi:hypothetical protein
MTEPDYPHRSTITLSDLSHVVLAVREAITKFDETTWWRGHAKAEWPLEAQVYRKNPENRDRSLHSETALIGHFVSRAPSRSHRQCPDAHDYFGWLFLAQHYGLPTRLLDWTENPLVAVYFAVEPPDDDGCIWGLSPSALNAALDGWYGLVQIKDPRVAKIAESAFNDISTERIIIAIDGQEIDPRMLAQMSRFTLHSDPDPLELMPDSPKWLRRYIIPKNAKANIRKQLSAFGIRRSNLFPDLASLATELKSTFW